MWQARCGASSSVVTILRCSIGRVAGSAPGRSYRLRFSTLTIADPSPVSAAVPGHWATYWLV
jgi:hypothetical protein